jgi:hypothetical protein
MQRCVPAAEFAGTGSLADPRKGTANEPVGDAVDATTGRHWIIRCGWAVTVAFGLPVISFSVAAK